MANAFKLFGEIEVNTAGFGRSLLRAEDRLKQTERAITDTERKAKSLGKTNAVTGRSFEKMNQSVRESRDRMDQAVNAYLRGEISQTKLASVLRQTDTRVNSLNNRIKDSTARLQDYAAKVSAIGPKLQDIGGRLQSFGQSMTIGVTAPLAAASVALFRNASSWDDLRNKLQAATGGADAAQAKFKELFNIAQSSPGVMTSFAVELYAMLKPMKLSETAITGLIKAFGRLKLQQPSLDISQFSRNLQQMFTTFDRQDFKEAFEQFPRFGEIVAEKFALSGSDIASVQAGLKELKDTGKLTYEEFIRGFTEAIEGDPSLGGLQETISTRFSKAMERISIAFEPLGKSIASAIQPIVDLLVPMIERLGTAFSALSPQMQTAIVAFGAIAAAAGPVIYVVGSIVSAIGALAASASTVGIVAAVIAGLAIQMAPVIASAALWYKAWQTNFGGIRDLVDRVAQGISAAWGEMKVAVEGLTAELTAKLNEFWIQNGEDISKAVTEVSEFVKSVWQGLLEFWASHGEDIKAVTKAVWESIKTLIKGALDIVLGLIRAAAAVINGDWSKLWEGVKQIVWGAFQAIIAIINANASLVFAAVRMLIENIFALKAWIDGQAIGLGWAIVEGMVKGIVSMHATAIGAVINLAKSTIEAAKEQLGIQSPSKVFFQIGKDVAQGFIDGLNSMKVLVGESIAKMFDVSGMNLKGGKKNAPGVELLTSMLRELSQFKDVSRETEILAELTAKAYEKQDKRLTEMLIKAAKMVDAEKRKAAWLERQAELIEQLTNTELPTPQFAEGNITGQGSGDWLEKLVEDSEKLRESYNDLYPPPPMMAAWDNFWLRMNQELIKWKSSLPSLKQAIGENLIQSIYNIGDVFGNAVAQWDGTAKGFFKSLAQGFKQMIQQIIAELIRLMVVKAIMNLIGSLAGSAIGGAAGGTGSLAGHGAGVPAGMASGGFVSGKGTSTSDSIAAMLSNGEFVMSAKAVKNWGKGFFENLNSMSPQMAFAGGGYVGGSGSSTYYNNTTTSSPVFNINVQGGGTRNEQMATASMLKREVMAALEIERRRNK